MVNSPTSLFEKDSRASKMIYSAELFLKWGMENVLDYGNTKIVGGNASSCAIPIAIQDCARISLLEMFYQKLL
jgi:hypothetical protein